MNGITLYSRRIFWPDAEQLACLAVCLLALFSMGTARADDSCKPEQGMTFVCGPINGEDLVWLPDSGRIVVSGMSAENTSGHLYLLDPQEHTYEELYPADSTMHNWDRETFAACPGELDPNNFSAHGLSIRAHGEGVHRLYVTGHGQREAVEIFEIDSSGTQPSIAWIGCIPIPKHNSINSVAALDDGGFLTTRIAGEGPLASGDIFAGDITGFLYEWRPGKELKRLSGTDMSGPNGIIVSADQQTVFVASWGRSEVTRFTRDTAGNLHRSDTIPLNFRVDNLRWTTHGTILAAGHRLAEKQDCGTPLCFAEWEIAEIDPQEMTARTRLVKRPIPGFTGATVAIADGDGLWLGTFHGDRIVYVPD